ncbi:unnamed protein product [Allacma fusca]|uniref:Uncharacterized protein n=1 Tax=Allacma fusca TaxID=39272 RepID=A0A8J2K5M4_9HEXA|nr:unnamed protein product [Allacma fusca]
MRASHDYDLFDNRCSTFDTNVVLGNTFTLFFSVVLFMSSIAGFVAAVILLKGSYLDLSRRVIYSRGNVHFLGVNNYLTFLLQTFMVYTVISYYISFVLSITKLYTDPGRIVKMLYLSFS